LIHLVGQAKWIKVSDDPLASDKHRKYSQMLIQSLLHQNGENLTAAIIANFVHSKGLPFSIVDKPTFHAMLPMARCVQLSTMCLLIVT
jgi:hypothetical protein